jgi:hypothetical protein
MEELASLHRYYIWANRLRIAFDEAARREYESGGAESSNDMLVRDSMVFLSHWYAALFVVIEGWGRLSLSDSKVGTLLSSPNVTLLKEFRHGVSHFEPTYFSSRFIDFFKAKDIVPWVRELNLAFGAYFLSRMSPKAGGP